MSAKEPVQKTNHSPNDSEHSDSEEGIKHRTHRYNLTPVEIQRLQLEKLLRKVDKPVNIPEMVDKPKLKPPKDIVRNVQGSSAGAGSGEFHVYRAHRRREYTRLKIMEEETKKEEERQDFEEKVAVVKAQEEEKTAKKRAKRQKKKQIKKQNIKKAKTKQEDKDKQTDTNDDNKDLSTELRNASSNSDTEGNNE
ncbi:369_t:CDS:2 [Funneliformis geosporum]|uniref:3345_t:CDS:1 n=1 Tax=Funneliformis geosporum TaxID=1117311 RepID=A0A9W4T0X1_9GLOM|nr:3345_t:CDS:2 [Funneliformis geosporum]CAI2188947.1 369_t:CDS:2 [Funneliformis geosporum]